VGYGQVIIHTTDGGVTWTTVPTGLTEQQFYVVRFLDQMYGWIGAQKGPDRGPHDKGEV